jgi:site-specific recombinase XerD
LSQQGTQITRENLLLQLKVHVNRYTDKHLYTHLLRTIFSTHHLSHGMDINSVAYAMNDTPHSVLKAYNQLMADTHRPIVNDANRAALANGHKPLTPPKIPIIPKPMKTDPDQMNLI